VAKPLTKRHLEFFSCINSSPKCTALCGTVQCKLPSCTAPTHVWQEERLLICISFLPLHSQMSSNNNSCIVQLPPKPSLLNILVFCHIQDSIRRCSRADFEECVRECQIGDVIHVWVDRKFRVNVEEDLQANHKQYVMTKSSIVKDA